VFYTQLFKHNFFHADMHPGNIFVSRDNPKYPQFIAVDFGIAGSLTDEDLHYMGENMLAFFQSDYRRVAQLHIDSGWVPAHTRVSDFEAAIRSVCGPLFEKPLAEISFGDVLLQLFQVARRFEMEVQPQLVLLQKTLLNIEGLGRQLYPDLDLWKTAKPFLEQWVIENRGPKAIAKKFVEQAPKIVEAMPYMPMLVHDYLKSNTSGNALSAKQSDLKTTSSFQGEQSLKYVIVGATVTVSAAMIASAYIANRGDIPWLIWPVAIIGLYCLLRGLFGRK